MQPTRILPDLQCSLVCEDVRQEANGSLIMIGIMAVLPVPQVPITAGRLVLLNRWCSGKGQFTEAVRLLAPDQTTVLRKRDSQFAVQDIYVSTTTVTVFGQVEFKTAGVYFIEVLVDDVMKIRYPLPVLLAQQGQAGSPSGEKPSQPPA